MRTLMIAIALVMGPALVLGHDYRPGDLNSRERPALSTTGVPPMASLREFATDTDVLHYRLDIAVDPQGGWLGGSNTITVRSLKDGLSTFRFGLTDALTIGAINVDGAAATWQRIDSATVEVELGRSYDADETFEVNVEYEGEPESDGDWGSIVFRRRSDDVWETWTLSQPWWAHTWWPCKDYIPDKATADLLITVPNDLLVASNGLLLDVQDVGTDQRQFHWRTDYQIATYLICMAITNYVNYQATWEHDGGDMLLDFYIYPEWDGPEYRAALLATQDMLDVFSELYGTYPFFDEKYGIYQWAYGGGMEHQTMTGQNYPIEWLTAHELSHSWWGDSITCATWSDIWLNEGFATYSEALWFEFKPGSHGEVALHAAMEDRRPSPSLESLYVYDASDMNRVFDRNMSYLTGAWVVHMFRHELGDEAFFDTLAAYRALYDGDSATTDDFCAVAEMVTGRELTPFFEGWVYGRGWPRYRYAWRELELGGQSYVELYLLQMRSAVFPSLMTMTLDVATDSGGNESRYQIFNDAEVEHFLWPVADGVIHAFELDPDGWILRYDDELADEFVEGPPKVVATVPAPEASVEAGAVAELSVAFHKDVNVAASDFELVEAGGATVELTLAYDAGTFTATLTPAAPLPAGNYTLTINDSVTDVAAGLALDGELEAPQKFTLLPSGDGEPGGATVVHFTAGLLLGDLNCDNELNFDDIDGFVLALGNPEAYVAQYPECNAARADINGDGAISFDDISPFVSLLGGS